MKIRYTHFFGLSLAYLLCVGQKANAQNDLLQQFQPQSTNAYRANPAYIGYEGCNKVSFFNLGVGLSSTSFAMNDLKKTDLNSLYNQFSSKNSINQSTYLDLFGYQWAGEKVNFSVNYGINQDINMSYSNKTFQLLWGGNAQFLGQTVQADNNKVNISAYHEIGFGISNTSDVFSYGVRVKYLVGIANINFNKMNFDLYTDPNNYQLQIKPDIELNTSGFNNFNRVAGVEEKTVKPADNLFQPTNSGAALDLGLSYKATDKMRINFSALNALGFINWGANSYQYKSNGSSIDFKGFDGNRLDTLLKYNTQESIDSLANTLKLNSSKKSYTTLMLPKIYLNAIYNYNESTKLGLMLHYNANIEASPILTAMYSKDISPSVNTIVCYSIGNNNYLNLGLGLGLNLGRFQLNVASDNVIGTIALGTARTASFRLGMAIKFYKKSGDPKFHEDNPVQDDFKYSK